MTTFEDGPAKGQTLTLQRAPVFLRVVHDGQKWDALDQLEDTPVAGEKIYAYKLHGEAGRAFMDGVKNGRRCGWTAMIATYQIVIRQPCDDTMRDTAAWQAWCQNNGPLIAP